MTQPSLPKRAALEPPKFGALRTLAALVLREMSASYGSSPGGYIWAVLQPLGMVLILTFAFSLVLRAPSLGTSFVLFYTTGYLPYLFYVTLSQKIAMSLRYSRALLAYPGVTWIDTVLARFFLNFITTAVVFCIVISGVLLVIETRTILTLGPIFQGVGICILVGVAVGLVNAVLFGLFPVWLQIWAIVSRPLFLASGIFYLYEDLPQAAQDILWWNPLVHGIGLVRVGFYQTYRAEYVSFIYCCGGALTLIAFGLIFLRANHKIILER